MLLHHLSPKVIIRRDSCKGIVIKNTQIFYNYKKNIYKVETELHQGGIRIYYPQRRTQRDIIFTHSGSTGSLCYMGERKITKISGKILFNDPDSGKTINIRSLIESSTNFRLFPVNSDLIVDFYFSNYNSMDSLLNYKVKNIRSFYNDSSFQSLEKVKASHNLLSHFDIENSSLVVPHKTIMSKTWLKLLEAPFKNIIFKNTFFDTVPISLLNKEAILSLINNENLKTIEFRPVETITKYKIPL